MNFLRFFQSEPPSTILGGRYKVIKQLGAGGFGQTFLAEDLHLPGHPHCVVKRLQPQFSNPASLQTAKRLFDTEAQTLYALGNHDQIPKLLAHFEQEQEFYLAQELIVGHSLSCEVRDGHPWQEAQVVGLLRDILEVLAFVHQQHVIHRDIKPANLIRRHADGKIVLIDFGAVKQATTQLLNSASESGLTISIGTPGYMPNEQLAGNPRFSSDVYAVGMIAIHALSGISPRSLPKNAQTSEIEWQDRVAETSAELAAVLDQMVSYDFRARYATASEALAAIAQVPIAPAPPPLLGSGAADTAIVSASPSSSITLPPPRSASSALPAPAAPATSRFSQQATLPLRADRAESPIAPSNRQRWQFSRAELSRIWLPLAGAATVVLLFSVRPFLSVRPTQDAPSIANPTRSEQPTPSPDEITASLDPQPQAAARLAQADQLREQNQFQQALAVYDEAIALDPSQPEAHWGRCYSLNALEQLADAIAACDAALELDPNYAEALWSKGYALDRQEQNLAALTLYEQAIEQKPDFAQAWSNKGTVLVQLDRLAEAIVALDRAVELDPNLAEAWSNRGSVLWSLRRFEEALASVDRATQLQPDNASARSLQQQMRQRLNRS